MTKLQLKGKLRFLDKGKNKDDTVRLNNDKVQEPATDVTLTFEYPFHNPAEMIYLWDGLMAVGVDLCGPNIVGTRFKPTFQCIRTGSIMMRGHHCPECRSAPTRNCVLNGHFFFCCEWVKVNGVWVRCGYRFHVESGGCAQHPIGDAPINSLIKKLKEGKIDKICRKDLNLPSANDAFYAQNAAPAKTNGEIATEQLEELESDLFTQKEVGTERFQLHVRFEQQKKDEQIRRRTEAAEKKKLEQELDIEFGKLPRKISTAMVRDPGLRKRWRVEMVNTILGRWADEKAAKEREGEQRSIQELKASQVDIKKSRGTRTGHQSRKTFGKGRRHNTGDQENVAPD